MFRSENVSPPYPCIRLARGEIWIDQSSFSRREIFTVLTSMWVNKSGIEIRQLLAWEMALTFHAKGFFVSKLLNWHQKWVTDIWLVVRRVLPGRRIVVLFWTKYAVRSQIKPGILKLTLRRGQFNFSIVYIFISCKENGHFNVVLVGQLRFNCHSYCGRCAVCKVTINRPASSVWPVLFEITPFWYPHSCFRLSCTWWKGTNPSSS